MKEVVVGTTCLLGAWWISYKAARISDWLAFGAPILLGASLGVVTHSWTNGLVCLSPIECYVLIWALGRIWDPFVWSKQGWVDKLLLLAFTIPVLLGIAVGLLFHSWFAGVVFALPAVVPFVLLWLWFQEQRAIQEMTQASQSG